MRLRPAQRIRHTREIDAVRTQGRARETGLFRIQVWTKATSTSVQPKRRLVVIASRRVGNAVHRNRCKRLLRDVFRRHQDHLPHVCDVALIARRRLVDATSKEVGETFLRALNRFEGQTSRQGPHHAVSETE